jgi:hypothetical protein
MKYALFVIERPEKLDHDKRQEWSCLLQEICSASSKIEGIENLRESFWQIPLQDGLSFLGDCIRATDKLHYRWQVLILDEKPSWIYSKTA